MSGAILIDRLCVFERTMHVEDSVVRYIGDSCRCCCCSGEQSIIISRLEKLVEEAFRLGESCGEDFFGAGDIWDVSIE